MKKAVIFFYSIHHGNTKKIVEAIAAHLPVRLVSVPVREEVDLSEYDLVGFASGIYMSALGKPVISLMNSLEGISGKDCFTIYTCGAPKGDYNSEVQAQLLEKGATVVGVWHCRGYDTFGPFKLIGGIAKGRPNEKDAQSATAFVQKLLEE